MAKNTFLAEVTFNIQLNFRLDFRLGTSIILFYDF